MRRAIISSTATIMRYRGFMAIPTCDYCERTATITTFLVEQCYQATLTIDGDADLNHCKPIGEAERVGDTCYYCEQHADLA